MQMCVVGVGGRGKINRLGNNKITESLFGFVVFGPREND